MIKHLLKIVGLTLLLLVIVLVGGLSWMIGTESGFQQTLALAQRFAPGTLTWDEADGKLAGPLRMRGLHYVQDDGVEASVGALDVEWRPSALFGAELAVDQLHLDGVEIRLAEAAEAAEEAPSDGGLPDISLPVSVSLDDIAITNVSIYPPGQQTATQIDRLALSARVEGSDVHLAELEVIAPQGEFHLDGDVQTRDDYPMDLTARWQADIGQSSPLQGQGSVTGSLARLELQHQVTGFAEAELDGTVSDVVEAPAWDVSLGASLPDPESLSPLLTGTPQVTLETSGTLDEYQAQVAADLDTTETGRVSMNAEVGGSTEVLHIRSLVARLEENGGEVSAAGQVTLASLQSDIQGQWQSLGWPVQGTQEFSSANGSFEATGTPDDFKASLSTDVSGKAIPEGQWTASVEGSSTALQRFQVEGQTLDGKITTSGAASWADQPEWDIELVTDRIDPGKQWSDLPGSIDLTLSSTGRIEEDGPQLRADIERLSGSLRKQPLAGSGSLQLAGEALDIDALEVTHGASRLEANGQIDEQIALDIELSSPDLGTALPELAGAVSVAGTVSGTRDAPRLDVRGTADDLAYAENRVSTLNLDMDAGLGVDAVSSLSVDASGITAGGQEISDITLSGKGTQAEHSLSVSAATSQGDLATQLDGSYADSAWNGFLSSLQLDRTPAGDWRLRERVALSASAEKADLSTLCLDNGDELGTLCLSGNWLAEGESTATLSIDALSPDLAREYLPPGLDLDTALVGDATGVLGADGALSADVNLALEPGALTLDAEPEPIEIGLQETTLDASLRDDDASLNVATALTDLGDLEVEASITDLSGAGTLAGSLDADFPDLSLISAFVPQIQQVSGGLESDVSLGGSVKTPQIEGELALRDFSAEIPETAMVIEDTQLVVTGKPDGTLLIDGQSRSGDGELRIDGSIDPGTQTLDIDIEGDRYQVANTAMMQAVVSPQLAISMDNSGMQVNGEVTIPRVYINANGGTDGIETVSASSDVVYASEESAEAEEPAGALAVDVKIILGDSVEVEAGDFRGRLEGDLRVEQAPGIAPRGTGTINVLNGDYVIYGQELDMERGQILFSGGPVDNPSLDMEVARTVQEYEVVAGAKIQGTAQAPRLELYSEPPMPDASILSYILIGQPPGTTGGSYTLGKYLTPDLYVSYGIGLFDAINTFNMRYTLTDTLAVEAASGSGSSADLIYTIER